MSDLGRPALAGHVGLVTGSTQGIGLATALALCSAGADVMLTDIAAPADLDALLRRFEGMAGSVAFVAADLADEAAIGALAAAVSVRFGAVDMLVNNAAVRTRETIESIEPGQWENAFRVNLHAPFNLIRAVLPGMRQKGWGRIVNIASGFGITASSGRIDYVTTKTALVGMTRAVALDLAEAQITCNAVCPGATWTPRQEARLQLLMDGGLSNDAAAAQLREKLGCDRFVAPESIAAAVLFLCGEPAGEITGVALPVDAGFLAAH